MTNWRGAAGFAPGPATDDLCSMSSANLCKKQICAKSVTRQLLPLGTFFEQNGILFCLQLLQCNLQLSLRNGCSEGDRDVHCTGEPHGGYVGDYQYCGCLHMPLHLCSIELQVKNVEAT